MTDARSAELDRLGQAGAAALRRRDPRAARGLFETVVTERPSDIEAWFGLALAARGLDDGAGQLAALDRVLNLDPGHLLALMMKADHFAKAGDGRAAETFYRAVVSRAPALETLSPDIRGEVRRASDACARYAGSFEAHLLRAVGEAGFDATSSSARFAQSLDLLLGRKRLYLQAPTSFYFPELPQKQFYERSAFPWVAELEARTEVIRQELLTLVSDEEAFQPYVRGVANRPPGEFGSLMDSRDWGAFYLIESGAVVPDAAARCPRTLEAMEAVPLSRATGRTPSVLFSRLLPGVRIPPHNGQINARLICHLPLIVPEGCALRVGNEVRPWVEGEVLIFDDTIEHEAWNTSRQPRVVLLFEVWRPELSAEEQALVAATLAAVGSYTGAN